MMGKLLKHEWLRTCGLLGTIVAIAPLLVGVGTLLTATGWPVISLLGIGLTTLTLGGLVPLLQIALAVDYWRSSYSKTGYFTHSLPLRGWVIYCAKLLWAVAVTLVGTVVTIALVFGAWPVIAAPMGVERNPLTMVGELFSTLTEAASPLTLVIATVLFIGMLLIWPVQYFFAASIGSETPLNRLGLGGPVLVFLGVYMASQLLVFIGLFALPWGIGLVDGDVAVVTFNLLSEMTVGASGPSDVMPIGFIPALVLLTVLCLARTVHSWNRKVSLV